MRAHFDQIFLGGRHSCSFSVISFFLSALPAQQSISVVLVNTEFIHTGPNLGILYLDSSSSK